MIRRFPLIVLLLAAGCGSRAVPIAGSGEFAAPVAASSAPVTAAPITAAPMNPVPDAAPSIPTSGGAGGGRAKQPVDYGEMGPADFNTMALSVTLSAACATPGQTMQATAVTEPGSKLAFAAGYSDNDFVPNHAYVPGEANPTGTFTWSWQITPTTPRGDAVVYTVAAKEDRGASYKSPFRVADSC